MVFTLQILCVFAMIACGAVARRRGLLTAQGTTDLARVSIGLIYPALIFVSITELSLPELRAHLALPLLTMLIALTGFGLGLIAVRFIGRVPRETNQAFLFHCLINNYLFLPLPLILFRYGEKGVAYLVFASVGYELFLWSLGVVLFTKKITVRQRIRSLLSPPFVTLLFSLLFITLRDTIAWPPMPEGLQLAGDTLRTGIRTLGQATVAIAMLVAGSRFAVMPFRSMLGWRVWLVTGIRLLAVPLIMIPLLQVIPMDEMSRGILTIIAVMPSAIASILFSERYGGDTDFIAGGLLLSHLWALITVPLLLAWAL